MEIADTYTTILTPGEGLYKEKGSKFISIATAVQDEQDFKEQMIGIKKRFYDARHHCYAYRLGLEEGVFRSSDDGEPSGSAGKPILNQIYSYEMYHTVVVVVRYFGGTKLGVSGLGNAYKTAAREALDNAKTEVRFLTDLLQISCDYSHVDQLMRFVREEELKVVHQKFEMNCALQVEVKKSLTENILEKLGFWHEIVVNKL
ncbi:MAG: YigZ family protein [Bacteroidales bacterium]|nr:YigZ family protein [Bacteroidales bacterium]